MPRSLSSVARRAIYAPQTGEVFAVLLTLEHPSFLAPIRVNSSGGDLVSGGHTYQNFPFEFILPDELEDSPSTVGLRICNVDRSIVQAIRAIPSDRVTVTASIVTADDPETIEAGPFSFSLLECSYDSVVVEGTIGYEDLLNEPFPGDSVNPASLPAIF